MAAPPSTADGHEREGRRPVQGRWTPVHLHQLDVRNEYEAAVHLGPLGRPQLAESSPLHCSNLY